MSTKKNLIAKKAVWKNWNFRNEKYSQWNLKLHVNKLTSKSDTANITSETELRPQEITQKLA